MWVKNYFSGDYYSKLLQWEGERKTNVLEWCTGEGPSPFVPKPHPSVEGRRRRDVFPPCPEKDPSRRTRILRGLFTHTSTRIGLPPPFSETPPFLSFPGTITDDSWVIHGSRFDVCQGVQFRCAPPLSRV